jgi:hypothetical protein
MFNVTKHGHLYDPKCRCHQCIKFEFELEDSIRAEQRGAFNPPSEIYRPITDNTFKS